jgi:hypothetical protein
MTVEPRLVQVEVDVRRLVPGKQGDAADRQIETLAPVEQVGIEHDEGVRELSAAREQLAAEDGAPRLRAARARRSKRTEDRRVDSIRKDVKARKPARRRRSSMPDDVAPDVLGQEDAVVDSRKRAQPFAICKAAFDAGKYHDAALRPDSARRPQQRRGPGRRSKDEDNFGPEPREQGGKASLDLRRGRVERPNAAFDRRKREFSLWRRAKCQDVNVVLIGDGRREVREDARDAAAGREPADQQETGLASSSAHVAADANALALAPSAASGKKEMAMSTTSPEAIVGRVRG